MRIQKFTLPVVRTLPLFLALAGLAPAVRAQQTPLPTGQRLRALGDVNDLYMGCFYSTAEKDGNGSNRAPDDQSTTIATREYNLITCAGEMKFKGTEPSRNSFTFAKGDEMLDWADSIGAAMHGHTLVWYTANPHWLEDVTWDRPTLLSIMNNHIDNVVGHWKGRIYAWDVVNEAISNLKSDTAEWRNDLRYRNTGENYVDPWASDIGWDYIELAFKEARRIDPAALLVYNDNDQEEIDSTKAKIQFQMLRDLRTRGIPVDAVGFQCHWNNRVPNFEKFGQNLDHLAELGLKVFITELDTLNPGGSTAEPTTQYPMKPNVGNDLQARTYYGTLDKALRCPAVIGVQVCGVSDRNFWLNGADKNGVVTDPQYGLPFDSWYKGYNAKPAYYALQDALTNQYRSELLVNGGFESGTASWSTGGPGTLTAVADSHSGNGAVKATGRTATYSGMQQTVTAKLDAQGAGRYYLSGWAKFATGSGTVRITLRTKDKSGKPDHTASVSAPVGTTWTHVGGWVDVTWDMSLPLLDTDFKVDQKLDTLNAALVQVDTPNTTADFYLDDVRVGDGNVVANGNFEQGVAGWTGINGAAVAASTSDTQHHYGLGGVAVTGRTVNTQGPQQNVLSVLRSQGAGNYNFESYMKLASGNGTGRMTLRLTDGSGSHDVAVATGGLNSVGWTKVASSAPVNVTWTGTLTAASLYLDTTGGTADFYADEVLMRQ